MPWFNASPPIRSPENRSHVALPLTKDVFATLRAALLAADGQWSLSPSARLVELSAMVVFPGAAQQDPHSDVPPDYDVNIGTLWLALQDVTASMGPLTVYSAEPAAVRRQLDWRSLHEYSLREERRRSVRHFDSDGEPAESSSAPLPVPPAAAAESAAFLAALGDPVPLLLKCGDVALMDCRTFHFGSKHTGGEARAVLSVTFEEDAEETNHRRDGTEYAGFTRLLDPSVAARQFRLGDFKPNSCNQEPTTT